MNSVRFTTRTAAWICGNNGTVLKNNNSIFGNTIRNVSGGGIPSNATLVHIACRNYSGSQNDTSNALVAGYIGTTTYVWRTTNGGLNWTQVFSQPNGFINAIWDWYPNLTFMQGNPVGGRWSLWKSTNFGLTWDSAGLYLQQSGSEHGWPNSVYNDTTSKVWFGTNNSRIYYSSNSGYNWTILPTAPEQNIYVLSISTIYNLGFAGGSTLMRSTDYGLNWNPISSMGSGNFGGTASFYWSCWYVRSNNNIYYSQSSGSNWTIQYTAPSGNYRYLYFMFLPQQLHGAIYALRDNGGISRYIMYLNNINPISSEIPSSFSLSQNYPNPFNPVTKIQFALPKNAFAKLTIYDVLGREVTTLVNEQLAPGVYEVGWDGTNYPSGVYYYKLTSGDFTQTNKMILIK